MGLISAANYDFEDLDPNCVIGAKVQGRPAPSYLSGVSPQADAEVTGARGVIFTGGPSGC
jgi:hypothetical protein